MVTGDPMNLKSCIEWLATELQPTFVLVILPMGKIPLYGEHCVQYNAGANSFRREVWFLARLLDCRCLLIFAPFSGAKIFP